MLTERLPSRRSASVPLARGRTSRRLRAVSGRLCQALDLILLGGVVLGLVLLPLFGHDHGTLAKLFQLKVSLRNVVIAVFCVSTWRVVLISIGVYSPARTTSIQNYIFRCVIGLNSCACVVGLIEVVLGGRVLVWHMVELFWVLSLALMAVARILLLAFHHLLRPLMGRRRSQTIVASGGRAHKVR